MAFRIIFILFLGLSIKPSEAQIHIPYGFKQYQLSDGLPSNMVYGGGQDSKGYIWFYTISGVCRFDGRRFQSFSINDSLADNETLSGFEDSFGRMWFSAFNGRLAYFDTKNEKIISYRRDTVLARANCNSYISSFREDAAHNIWILSERRSLTRLDTKGRVLSYDHLPKRNIYAIVTDASQNFYFLSDSLFIYDIKKDTFRALDCLTRTQPIFRSAVSGNQIFYETLEGIKVYRNNKVETILPRSAYAQKAVSALSVDALGMLWIGVNDGAICYSLADNRMIDFQYTGAAISGVFSDAEGNIWLTSLNDGIFCLPMGYQHIKYLGVKDGLKHTTITALTRDRDGDVLIAASPNDLYYVSEMGQIKAQIELSTKKPIVIHKLYFHNEDLWLQVNNNHLQSGSRST